jgi:hypothetical protein
MVIASPLLSVVTTCVVDGACVVGGVVEVSVLLSSVFLVFPVVAVSVLDVVEVVVGVVEVAGSLGLVVGVVVVSVVVSAVVVSAVVAAVVVSASGVPVFAGVLAVSGNEVSGGSKIPRICRPSSSHLRLGSALATTASATQERSILRLFFMDASSDG